jgi:hypothetical protein
MMLHSALTGNARPDHFGRVKRHTITVKIAQIKPASHHGTIK